MLKNYFKIALRNLQKNKVYSFINIGGLAVGMAVAMLIGLWVYDEISYNRNYQNYDRIAQVHNHIIEPLEKKADYATTLPQPMAKVLREKYGHLFKHVILIQWAGDYSMRIGENNYVKKGQFFDNGVIDMFSIKMLKGSKESLNDPQAIVISESTSKSLFAEKEPIGQIIKLNNKINCKITGVYEDIAKNSFLGDVQFIGNFENTKATFPEVKANETNWHNSSQRLFVQTADNVNVEQANAAIKNFYFKDAPDDYKKLAKEYQAILYLNPMKNWYLYADFKDGYPSEGRITFVWLFAIVGLFVLILACINFMNLSTARSEKRAKEVGIRKAIGSVKSQLVNQFLSESFLVVFFAFIITLILVSISIFPFNELTDKNIKMPFYNLYFWLLCLTFIASTSLLSGFYPAFYLSSFEPIKVLKGTIRQGKYASMPRKVLVVVQFTVSIILIIGTIIVYEQIQYAQNRPIGYNKESLIRIPMDDPNFNNNKLIMKEEILRNGLADNVAFSSSPVTSIWDNWGGFTWKGKKAESESSFSVTYINEDYGKTIQWKIKQGRDYSNEFSTDSSAVIINESAAKYIGLKNPIGEFITNDDTQQRRQIIGVVEDVIADSPYEPVKMGFYWYVKNPNDVGQMLVKINPNISANKALAKIELIQKKLVPSAPFQFKFTSDEYGQKFKSEQLLGKLATLFTFLAIFISCLGLFGLASFVAEQRTKEIGIRKVLGASVASLWQMLSKDFVVLVIISCMIAAPIAYYFMSNWLQKYNYRTEISWWIFASAGIGAMFITLLTVSYQAIIAALVNPVKSLKSE
ncbi:MAG: ABC transporter permease [Bacteroidetes bacterium B1(2017)]|nr:MAG: ABC transporter permease [Bacteroidetes bacterium B1(2017)]